MQQWQGAILCRLGEPHECLEAHACAIRSCAGLQICCREAWHCGHTQDVCDALLRQLVLQTMLAMLDYELHSAVGCGRILNTTMY
jgi:hypothetical protein